MSPVLYSLFGEQMITFFTKNSNTFAVTDTFQPDCWVNVIQPTDNDADFLLNKIGVPESFFDDIRDQDERPRIESEQGWELYIIRIPLRTDDEKQPFVTVPLGILFKDALCVTICFSKVELMEDFIHYSIRKNILVRGNTEFVLRFLLSSSVWYLKYLKQINVLIKLAEGNLEKSIRNEDLQALLRLEKCLVYFITSLKGNDSLFLRMNNTRSAALTELAELTEDVSIELKQAQEMAGIYSNILSGMMDAYASVISNNLNVIMKRLTSISLLLMIPTLIASLYGMNVRNGLETNPYALLIIVFVSIVFSAAGIWVFKKKNWY